jgi:transcriptional regulator with XRE-family HTH domain
MKLTRGESLELWLRATGTSKGQYARAEGVSPNVVTNWINDRVVGPTKHVKLRHADRLWLFRRRAGWTIREMARRYGVSHVSVIRWERGQGRWERGIRWWENFNRRKVG